MNELTSSQKWIEKECETIKYGIVSLSIVIHQGKITRIEKSVTVKEQIEEVRNARSQV